LFRDCVFFSRFAGLSDRVDIFNVLSGAWSTSALSIGRANLAASSLPAQALVVFAGGNANGTVALMHSTAVCALR
jgi:hypothetical protein